MPSPLERRITSSSAIPPSESTARSSFPSPLRSPIAKSFPPSERSFCTGALNVPSPATPLSAFPRRMFTELSNRVALITSRIPSPSTSTTVMASTPSPPTYDALALNVPSPLPRRMFTESSAKPALITSRLPSPSKSAVARL